MPRPPASVVRPAHRPEKIRRSFDERPSREAEEHVFERGAADERRERLEPLARDVLESRLAVVGVDEDAIGEDFDAIADAAQPSGDLLIAIGPEAHLEHFTARVLAD